MRDPQERLAELEALVAELRTRLLAVEERLSPSPAGGAPRATFLQKAASQAEEGDSAGSATPSPSGELSLSGSVQVGDQSYRLRIRESTRPFFEAAPKQLAQLFTALGSPHRIIIMRTLCEGPRTALQLQEALGMSSVGQLYHHLRELVAVGLVTQQPRSAYTIAPAKLMWIYLILAVGYHLMPAHLGDLPAEPTPDPESEVPGEP